MTTTTLADYDSRDVEVARRLLHKILTDNPYIFAEIHGHHLRLLAIREKGGAERVLTEAEEEEVRYYRTIAPITLWVSKVLDLPFESNKGIDLDLCCYSDSRFIGDTIKSLSQTLFDDPYYLRNT